MDFRIAGDWEGFSFMIGGEIPQQNPSQSSLIFLVWIITEHLKEINDQKEENTSQFLGLDNN